MYKISLTTISSLTLILLIGCSTTKGKITTEAADDSGTPKFSNAEVRRVWVPDKIDGNKYIKGHYMYLIERGSVWTMP
jgi:hypothetical protein